MRLTTRRLEFRPLKAGDFDAIHALATDFEVIRWTATWPWPADPEFTLKRISSPVTPAAGFAGAVVEDGRVVGTMSLVNGELGYMLDRSAWGRGVATEIGHAVVAAGFERLKLDRIGAGVFDGNDGSMRVLGKLGFRETGRGTLFCRAQGAELAGPDFALTLVQWTDQQPLDTPRLRLRPVVASDAGRLHAILSHPEVARWLPWPEHPFPRAAATRLARNARPWMLAVERDGLVIGCISVADRLGYWLDPAHHRQGLATEAATALVARHFTAGGGAVASDHIVGNTASRRILDRLGFQPTARVTEPSLPLARPVEVDQLVLTPDAWAARPPGR